MSYEEWYKKFVESNPEEFIAEKKWKNRFSDKKQFEKYIKILGKEIPQTLEEFQDMKYNSNDKYERLKREYRTIKEIKTKNWNDSFKEKATNTYYNFREQGFETSSHFLARFLQRKDENINLKKIVEILKKPINYVETKNGNNIRYYSLVRIVTNKSDNEIITVVKNKLDISKSKIKEGAWIVK